MEKQKDFIFSIQLITLAISIITVIILIVLGLYIDIIYVIVTGFVLWVMLKIQDIKIKLLYSINEKLEK